MHDCFFSETRIPTKAMPLVISNSVSVEPAIQIQSKVFLKKIKQSLFKKIFQSLVTSHAEFKSGREIVKLSEPAP